MKIIEFQQVGMENFCNYIEPMELNFENGKLVVITGPNGVGKSNIFNAIPYTLYGITADGKRGDDVVNNIIGKDCHTWVKFKINDDDYEAHRYHKYTKRGNTVELSKNGEKPYKVGHREAVAEIERLIEPRKLFINTLLFSQNIKDFFTGLDDSKKKDIFRSILQLDNYTLYHEEVKNRIKDISEKIIELNQLLKVKTELLTYSKEQLNILKESEKLFIMNKNKIIESYKSQLNDLMNANNECMINLEIYKKSLVDIDKFEEKFKLQNQKLYELESEYLKVKESILNKTLLKESELKKSASEDISKIKTDSYKKKNDMSNSLTQEIQRLTNILNSEVNNLNTNFSLLENEINSLKERISEIKTNVTDNDISLCPTCDQEIGEKKKEELQQKVLNYQKSIESKLIVKKEIIERIKNLEEEYKFETEKINLQQLKDLDIILTEEKDNLSLVDNRLIEVLLVLKNKSQELIKQYSDENIIKRKQLEIEAEELKKENEKLQDIKNKVKDLEISISSNINNIKMLEGNITQKESEIFDDKQLIGYKNKIKDLNNELKQISNKRKSISDNLPILEFWKLAYSPNGIPAMLIDESIPFLNKQVAYYLDKIARGRYTVSFDTMSAIKSGEFRDKISVNVLDNQTKANSRIQLSGGQARLIDIATILTLNDLQCDVQDVSFNILLFDEIFDSLDDSNIGYVSNVIRTLTQDRFVSIISHRHIDQIEADEYLNLN